MPQKPGSEQLESTVQAKLSTKARPASPQKTFKTQYVHHKLFIQNNAQVDDYLDAPETKTLPHDRRHRRAPLRHQARARDSEGSLTDLNSA